MFARSHYKHHFNLSFLNHFFFSFFFKQVIIFLILTLFSSTIWIVCFFFCEYISIWDSLWIWHLITLYFVLTHSISKNLQYCCLPIDIIFYLSFSGTKPSYFSLYWYFSLDHKLFSTPFPISMENLSMVYYLSNNFLTLTNKPIYFYDYTNAIQCYNRPVQLHII